MCFSGVYGFWVIIICTPVDGNRRRFMFQKHPTLIVTQWCHRVSLSHDNINKKCTRKPHNVQVIEATQQMNLQRNIFFCVCGVPVLPLTLAVRIQNDENAQDALRLRLTHPMVPFRMSMICFK